MGNGEELGALINDGRVIRLKENTEVRVIERWFELKMFEIKFPDMKTHDWVIDGSLASIKKEK